MVFISFHWRERNHMTNCPGFSKAYFQLYFLHGGNYGKWERWGWEHHGPSLPWLVWRPLGGRSRRFFSVWFYWCQLDGPVKKASTDVNSLCLRFSVLGQFRWEESEEAEAVKSKGAGKSKTGPSDGREALCTEVDPEPSPRAERRETGYEVSYPGKKLFVSLKSVSEVSQESHPFSISSSKGSE